MRSPFPGMDPYIEACNLWGDFHAHLIQGIFEQISEVLPAGFLARTNSRSYITLVEEEERNERHFEPDVSVTGPRQRQKNGAAHGTTTASIVPETDSVALRAFIEEEFDESFIDIFELEPERRLVTSIEVLSPSNKTTGSTGRKRYLRKRQALLRGKANLVEIDLLRGGERLPMLDPLPKSPYYLLVAREPLAPLCRVWPACFDRPLPVIPIPLERRDQDIPLALQPLVEQIYARSRYHMDIDYSQPLTPPLTAEESAWLQQQLQSGTTSGPSARAPKRRSRRRGS